MPRKVPSYHHYKPKNVGLVVIKGKQHYRRYGMPSSTPFVFRAEMWQ